MKMMAAFGPLEKMKMAIAVPTGYKVKERMLTGVAGELSSRNTYDTFLD